MVNKALDRVRQYLAKELDLIDKQQNAMLWVTDFPMYEYNEDEDRLEVPHSSPLSQAKASLRAFHHNKEI